MYRRSQSKIQNNGFLDDTNDIKLSIFDEITFQVIKHFLARILISNKTNTCSSSCVANI